MFIDSMPPAMTRSASPARISEAASMIALSPEPQTRLMVVALVPSGRPAVRAAWRAGAWPTPAWRTWPMSTSSTRGSPDQPGALDRGADRDAAELGGRGRAERATELADRRSCGADDEGLTVGRVHGVDSTPRPRTEPRMTRRYVAGEPLRARSVDGRPASRSRGPSAAPPSSVAPGRPCAASGRFALAHRSGGARAPGDDPAGQASPRGSGPRRTIRHDPAMAGCGPRPAPRFASRGDARRDGRSTRIPRRLAVRAGVSFSIFSSTGSSILAHGVQDHRCCS